MSDFLLSQAEIDALLTQIPKTTGEEAHQTEEGRLQPDLKKRVSESDFFEPMLPPIAEHPNLERILDIPLQLNVLLGQAAKPIADVVSLAPGSIVEFNRTVNEPVDILLNGKLIARGEVVVVDEYFGIRITQIVSPQERVKRMV